MDAVKLLKELNGFADTYKGLGAEPKFQCLVQSLKEEIALGEQKKAGKADRFKGALRFSKATNKQWKDRRPGIAGAFIGETGKQYITDEECAELPGELEKYKKEAEEFCEKAKNVVKAKFNPDGSYSLVDVPEAVKEDYKDYPKILKSWMREKKHIVFIGSDKQYWYAPGTFTLELDGVTYKPHWSYWMNCTYYLASDHIRKVAK